MESILEQLIGELKEVAKVLEELVFNLPRQNIIMIGGKHEEFYVGLIGITRISFEFKEFKNLIVL